MRNQRRKSFLLVQRRAHIYYAKFMRRKNRKLTKHHDQPRGLGGTFERQNIYMLSEEHHRAYHLLFGLRTFNEAAEVLMRMEKMHRRNS